MKKKESEDHFYLLRDIQNKPNTSQRKLAKDLGFSLGKLNYCLKELQKKGLIKIKNFNQNPNKLNYVYLLTPIGISEKSRMTINFMKKNMQEYDDLKKELEKN